jgi:Flp pilus assembly protein CpaB
MKWRFFSLKKKFKKIWNKYTRAGLIITFGLLFATVAYTLNNNMIAEQVQTKRVIIAKEDIAPFEMLTKEKLEFREVVMGEVPSDAIDNAESINFDDAYASKFGFLKGSSLRSSYITTAVNSELGAGVGLKDGMRLIGIKTDLVLSAGNEVKVGILVDAIAFVQAQDNERGGSVSEKVIDPTLSKLEVVKLLNAEGVTPDPATGRSLIPNVVVLKVTTEQASKLMEYQETGKVYLLPTGTATLN